MQLISQQYQSAIKPRFAHHLGQHGSQASITPAQALDDSSVVLVIILIYNDIRGQGTTGLAQLAVKGLSGVEIAVYLGFFKQQGCLRHPLPGIQDVSDIGLALQFSNPCAHLIPGGKP